MIFQYLVSDSWSLFAHRVGIFSNALRHAFAHVNSEFLTFQSRGVFMHSGYLGTGRIQLHRREKQTCRSNRELPQCTVIQLGSLDHQNNHVDYIIKTRSRNAKNHYMIIAMLSSIVHPACGDIPSWVVIFVNCYIRLIMLNYIVLYMITH